MKSTERVIFIIVICVLGLLVLAMGAYIVFDAVADYQPKEKETTYKKETVPPSNDENKQEKVVAKNSKFDYDGMQAKIEDYMDNVKSTHPYLSTCKLADASSSNAFDKTHKILSKDSITKVFNKLKAASKVEEIKYEVTCPGYSFSISDNIYSSTNQGDLLNIVYVPNKDNKKSLLVAIDVENYASSYTTKYLYSYDNESELDHFLEDLR